MVRDWRNPPPGHWMLSVIGVFLVLLGVALAIGGAWLAAIGGSWYYLPAGVGLIVAGIQLTRQRGSGLGWFALVFLATVGWTAWESGLDYWRWVPRLGLLVIIAFVLALFAPHLRRGPSRGQSRLLAFSMATVFAVAFALAFVPHGVYRAGDVPSADPATIASATVPAAVAAQPKDAPAAGDWGAYGRENASTRYSPLTQIEPSNVGNLERAWTFRTGDLPEHRWGAETTPLKIGDTLYLCSARNQLIALDARTGAERWRYDPKVSDESIPYTAACRGVAYFDATLADAFTTPESNDPGAGMNGSFESDPEGGPTTDDMAESAAASALLEDGNEVPPADASTIEPPVPDEGDGDGDALEKAAANAIAGARNVEVPGAADAVPLPLTCPRRIIEGTLDGRLVAVDADTGLPCPDFGVNGAVDITAGMGDTPPGMVSITSAPTIVRDVIVTGHQVLDGQRRAAPSGVIQGFDAITGQLRWAWDMARPDLTGLPADGDSYTRGTPNMWTTATGDEALGLVFLPMGNSAADYWSGSRTPEEDRYATSLVAIDVRTGRPAWHFQTVHIDVWDYDLGSQATLVDFPTASGRVPALVLPSKQGDMYVLDRRTGEPLTGVEERPVPGGGVEPERRSPTQPFSHYHTLAKAPLTERDMWGLTPIDQLFCRIGFRSASYEGMYTAPTADRYWIQYPGYNGGSDWGGIAVDTQRGIIVANYNDMPNHNRLVPREEADRMGWAPRDEARGGSMSGGAEGAGDPQAGTPYAIDVNAGWRIFTGLLCKQPPYGGIRAIELATGRTLWDRPFGSARANGPFGIPSMLPIEMGTPNNGGAVITAGGLVFIAAATDNLIRAIDIETGRELWNDRLPAGGQANPIAYEVDGRQYIAIMAGGHHFMETPIGDYLITYALPR
jgi:quinoprotein glucose dehydrogenase